MSYFELSVSAYGSFTVSDFSQIEASSPEADFIRAAGKPGLTSTYVITAGQFDRMRPGLDRLATRRIPVVDATTGLTVPNRTRPILTYTVEAVPGGRPRPTQLEGAVDTSAGATLTLRGTGLIPGTKASLIVSQTPASISNAAVGVAKWTENTPVIRFDAVMKGPIGGRISVAILAASGAGSVSTVERGDGVVEITVVPAAAGRTATAIASQVNGNALAAAWVTATAIAGSTIVTPFQGTAVQGPNALGGTPFRRLSRGRGTGVAFADFLLSGTDPTNALRLFAQKAGNQGNIITVTIKANQGANSIVVSGNDITVNRMAATTAISALVTAINGDAAANLLVRAVAIGSGNLGSVAQTYLAGGAGETPVATIGGAVGTIKSHTDTDMIISASAGLLTGAGVAAGEVAKVFVTLDYKSIEFDKVAV